LLNKDWAAAGFLLVGLSLIPFLAIAILPLLVAGSTLRDLAAVDNRRRWLSGPLLPLTLAGAALWLSEAHRPDIFHLICGSLILLIVLFAATDEGKPRLRNAVMRTLAVGLVLFGALNFLAHERGSHLVETRRGYILSADDEEALRFLSTATQRREFVFVYAYYPILYYLADVTNPTRFSILLYGYNTPQHFDEVIRNLEEKRVRYVLWDTEVYGDKLRIWFPGYRHPPDDKLKLEHYLEANYTQIALKSGFRILERKNRPA
jgi:hypothetical protein